MPEYYTSTGRYDLSTGEILDVETNLPLEDFELPDFFQTGDRVSSNLLYNSEIDVGSYYIEPFNKFYPQDVETGSLEYRKMEIGVNSIWKTDFVKSQRLHDYYTWTGIEFSGDITGMAVVEVAGLIYSGYSEGTLTGKYYHETGETPTFSFTGNSIVLASKAPTFSNFATTFFSGLRGSVKLIPLLQPYKVNNPYVDSETATGMAYLNDYLLNSIPSLGSPNTKKWRWIDSIVSGLVSGDYRGKGQKRDSKIFILRDSDTSTFSFGDASDSAEVSQQYIIERLKEHHIPVYDYYNTSSNTESSNPLSGIATFSSGYSPTDNAYVDRPNRIPDWVTDQEINMVDAPSSSKWLSPENVFQFDTSLYTFVGSGMTSGLKTGEITGGGIINITTEPLLLKTQTYGNYYEDKFRGYLDISASGRISFKDIFEEYFLGDYNRGAGSYGIKVSGTNHSNSLVTGDMLHIPYSGDDYIEGDQTQRAVNFNDFCVVAPVNLDGYEVSFASSVTVTGSPIISGDVYLASGLLDIDSTLHTGITGEFDFFDINFLSGDPKYFVETDGSTGMLSGELFHTYLLSDTGQVDLETTLTSAKILPADMPEGIFTTSIDPFFSNSISGDQVVSGINEERVEELLPYDTNLLKTSIRDRGTGRAYISGIFQGEMTYTGIYYKDDDALTGYINPAHDYHYKISELSDFNLNNLTGDGKVRIVDDEGGTSQVAEDVDIIFLFDRSGSMRDDIRACSAAIAASQLFDFRIVNASVWSYDYHPYLLENGLPYGALEAYSDTNMVERPGAYEQFQGVLNNITDYISINGGKEALSRAILQIDASGVFDGYSDRNVILCAFTDEDDDSNSTEQASALSLLAAKEIQTVLFTTLLEQGRGKRLDNYYNNLYINPLPSECNPQWVNMSNVNAANFSNVITEVATKGFANLDITAILSIDNEDLNDYLPDLFFADATWSQQQYYPPGAIFITSLELRGKTTRDDQENNVDDDFAILKNDEIIVSPARNIMWYAHQPPYSVYVAGGKIIANNVEYAITNVTNDRSQVFKVTDNWNGYGDFVVSFQERIDQIESLYGPVSSSSLELVVLDDRNTIRAWNAKPAIHTSDQDLNSLSVGVFSTPFIPDGFNISTISSDTLANAANRPSEIVPYGRSELLNSVDWPYSGFKIGDSSPNYTWSYTGNIFTGDKLEVAVFDGWGSQTRLVPWTAKITWSDGVTNFINGGYEETFPSDPAKIRYFEDTNLSQSDYLAVGGGGPWGEAYKFYEGGSGIIPVTRNLEQKFVQDMAYLQYDTNEIPFNIVQGFGFSVKDKETISSSDPIFVGDNNRPKAIWQDIGFVCDLEPIEYTKTESVDEDDGDEDEDEFEPCVPYPGCPSEDGGAQEGTQDGGGGADVAGQPNIVSGSYYSGSITFNKMNIGDYLEFSPYDFDYSGAYSSLYEVDFPNIYNLDNRFYYDRRGNNISTFSNAVELAYLLNGFYNNFSLGTNKRGVWQKFKTGLSEYATDEAGDFYSGALLKATAITPNFLTIESLIFGEMGAYKIKFKDEDIAIAKQYQYSMPASIGFQGSYDGQRWKNLFLKDFDYTATSHELLTDGYEIEKEPMEFGFGPELRVDNERDGVDSITITASDHVIESGDGVFLNQVESLGVTISSLGNSVFTGVDFPSGIDVLDYFEDSIRYEYSGNNSGSLLGFISGYHIRKPKPKDEDTDLGGANIVYPCPPVFEAVIRRSRQVVIDSGVDSQGNYFQITQEEEADCHYCDKHREIEIPFGHELNLDENGLPRIPSDPEYIRSGFTLCDQAGAEQPKEEPQENKYQTISFSGFFTGFEGEEIFISDNVFFRGSFNAPLEPKAIFEVPDSTATYAIGELEFFFDLISVRDRVSLFEEDADGNPLAPVGQETTDANLSYRTGFIFDNERDYRYYRLIYSGFQIESGNSSLGGETYAPQSGVVVFDEVNLYGPTNYQFDLSGEQDITLYDSIYSGDLLIPVSGRMTGMHVGSSFSGILPVNVNKTGIIVEDFFSGNQQIYPTEFRGNYNTTLTGIGEASGLITGLFYDTGTNKLFNEILIQQTVTGFDNVSIEVNQIDDILDVFGATDEQVFVDFTGDARFTGIGAVNAIQSGVKAFTTVTGRESGFIDDGSGSYDFYRSASTVLGQKMLLQNSGRILTEDSGNIRLEELDVEVFSSIPSGYINSQLTLNYNNPITGDRIIIDNNGFVRNTGNQLPNLFKDITGLRNVINSGELGFSASLIDDNTLQIFTNTLGELGNSIQASSNGSLNKPTFETDTFTGGQNFYQPLVGYGLFSGNAFETVNNTGIYEVDYTGDISGIINIFTGNKNFNDTWNLHTGKFNKDYNFRSNIPDGTITDIYEDGFHSMGIYPSQFNTFIDYIPSDLVDYNNTENEPDVAELIITGINLTGYTIPIHGDK